MLWGLMGLLVGCAPDFERDGYGRRHFEGRWDVTRVEQVYSGGMDSSAVYEDLGYWVLHVDGTADRNVMFVEGELGESLAFLGVHRDAGSLQAVSAGGEWMAYWDWERQGEVERFSVWTLSGDERLVSLAELEGRSRRKMVVVYREDLEGGVKLVERIELERGQ